MVTVVAMNVYVGLLSELYNEANKRRNQIFYHYTAEVRCSTAERGVETRLLAVALRLPSSLPHCRAGEDHLLPAEGTA